MTRGALAGAILGTLVLLLLGGTESFAQKPLDYRVIFTFSGPVSIPGVTLPAGAYVFRIMDNSTGHNVAQVTSSDGITSYSIFIVLRTDRPDYPNEPEVHFMETAANMRPAVRAWWITGERRGWEAVYPKEQAHLLAKGTNTAVLETSLNEPLASPDVAVPPLEVASPTGEDANLDANNAPPTAGPAQKGSVPPTQPPSKP
jgi:hypothetical protein